MRFPPTITSLLSFIRKYLGVMVTFYCLPLSLFRFTYILFGFVVPIFTFYRGVIHFEANCVRVSSLLKQLIRNHCRFAIARQWEILLMWVRISSQKHHCFLTRLIFILSCTCIWAKHEIHRTSCNPLCNQDNFVKLWIFLTYLLLKPFLAYYLKEHAKPQLADVCYSRPI